MYEIFPSPPKIMVPMTENGEENARLLNDILSEATQMSYDGVNAALLGVSKSQQKKVENAAEAVGKTTDEFLNAILSALAQTYLGRKTDAAIVEDKYTGRNITSGVTSIHLTALAELLGPKKAKQLYKIISADIDAVLEDRYGPPVISIPSHPPILTTNRLGDILARKRAPVPKAKRRDIALAKNFITQTVGDNTEDHWKVTADDSYSSGNNTAPGMEEISPPDKHDRMVVATAHHVNAEFIDALHSVIHHYNNLYKDGMETPATSVSTLDGENFSVSVKMRETLQRDLARAILRDNMHGRK